MQPALAPDVLAIAGIVVLALVCGLIRFTHTQDRPADAEPTRPGASVRGALGTERQAKT